MSGRGEAPIRVLHVIAGLDPVAGGPPAAVVATALALRSLGVSNTVAYVDGSGRRATANAERLEAAGINTHSFSTTRGTGGPGVRWGISIRLAVWLLRRADHFDVMHTHGAWTFTAAATLVVARIRRRVAVLSAHESLTDYDQKKSGTIHKTVKKMMRWVYLRAFDVVVVASNLEQRDMRDHAGVHSVVVPHAIAMSIASAHRKHRDESEFRIGFLGRLHPKKNVELLIDALASLPDHAVLYVAGDGPQAYRESLLSRAESRGVTDRVRWCGFLDEEGKQDFFASVDALAMPSAFECFGLAAVEGLKAGLPVVVSPDMGIADVVRDHRCGHVAAAEASEIRRALRDLMANDVARRDFARNARLAASSEFSSRVHGERLRAQYEVALGIAAPTEPSGR